jgi:hypothetical protein
MKRISTWRAPTWQDYFDIVTDLLAEVAGTPSR